MTRSGTLAATDLAVSALSKLPDDDLADALTRVLMSRPDLQVAVRDDLLTLIQLNLSAPTVMDGLVRAALDRMSALQPPSGSQTSRLLRIEGEARAAVLSHPMLTASEVADLVHATGKNRRDAASTLRRHGSIVGIRQGNRYLYPAFQFDHQYAKVRPIVAEANSILGAVDDPWGVASWWLSPSGRLPDGHSPADEAAAGRDDTVGRLVRGVVDDD